MSRSTLRSFFSVLALLALLQIASTAHAERADVVVVGGGPGGLAAAIEAKLAGAGKVVVIEKRGEERRRVNMLAIYRGSLNNLARLGVRVDQLVRPLSERITLDASGVVGTPDRVGKLQPDASKATHTVRDLVPRKGRKFGPVGVVPINDLETELIRAARAAGVDVRFFEEVTDLDQREDGVSVSIAGKDAIEADYVALFDGAHSSLRDKLGVKRQALDPDELQTRMAVARFATPGDGKARWRTVGNAKGTHRVVSQLGGVKNTVLAELGPGQTFRSEKQLQRWFRGEAAKVDASGAFELTPRVFNVELQKSDRATVGNRIFLGGDAVRTVHVFTGLGTNSALRDAMRFGTAIGKLRGATTAKAIARVLGWYGRETGRATDRVHGVSRTFFTQRDAAARHSARAGSYKSYGMQPVPGRGKRARRASRAGRR